MLVCCTVPKHGALALNQHSNREILFIGDINVCSLSLLGIIGDFSENLIELSGPKFSKTIFAIFSLCIESRRLVFHNQDVWTFPRCFPMLNCMFKNLPKGSQKLLLFSVTNILAETSNEKNDNLRLSKLW